jgi:FkbM family methyltransferase
MLNRFRPAVLARLSGRPRVLRLPRLVPVRSLRSRLYRSYSWALLDDLRPPLEVSSIGGRMLVDTVDVIGRVIAASGEWEPHVTAAFRSRLRAGDVCIDVGAHIGYYTLLASKLVGAGGHVYSFEPSPGVYRTLRTNLTLNAAKNVTALNVAAGAAEASAVLQEAPGGTSGNSSVSPRFLESPHAAPAEEYTRVEVSVRTVESLVPPEEFGRVRMIKVDVEGYEVEALRGIERILAAGGRIALIVELSPEWSSENPAAFLEELRRRHRLAVYRLANEYTLDGFFPARIEAPVRIERIPSERCDLLLVRES